MTGERATRKGEQVWVGFSRACIQHIVPSVCEKCKQKYIPVKDKGCMICYFGIKQVKQMNDKLHDFISSG